MESMGKFSANSQSKNSSIRKQAKFLKDNLNDFSKWHKSPLLNVCLFHLIIFPNDSVSPLQAHYAQWGQADPRLKLLD